MTNTEALNELIRKSGLKKKFLAEQLNLSAFGLQKKIENMYDFKSTEIAILCNLLKINSLKQKEEIFFTKYVDK